MFDLFKTAAMPATLDASQEKGAGVAVAGGRKPDGARTNSIWQSRIKRGELPLITTRGRQGQHDCSPGFSYGPQRTPPPREYGSPDATPSLSSPGPSPSPASPCYDQRGWQTSPGVSSAMSSQSSYDSLPVCPDSQATGASFLTDSIDCSNYESGSTDSSRQTPPSLSPPISPDYADREYARSPTSPTSPAYAARSPATYLSSLSGSSMGQSDSTNGDRYSECKESRAESLSRLSYAGNTPPYTPAW